ARDLPLVRWGESERCCFLLALLRELLVSSVGTDARYRRSARPAACSRRCPADAEPSHDPSVDDVGWIFLDRAVRCRRSGCDRRVVRGAVPVERWPFAPGDACGNASDDDAGCE